MEPREDWKAMLAAARAERIDRHAELYSLGGPWAELLEDLVYISAADARAVEALRLDYCETCAKSIGKSKLVRDDLCNTQRCGLRDSDKFHTEQQRVTRMLDVLLPTETAKLKDVQEFNQYIAEAGCLTPGVVDSIGKDRLVVSYQTPTLRAAIQLSLLEAIITDASKKVGSRGDLEQGAESRRRFLDVHRSQMHYEQQLAYRLWERGQSEEEIVEHLKLPRGTIARWIQEMEVRRLWHEGSTQAEIIEHLNISQEDVVRWLPEAEALDELNGSSASHVKGTKSE